VNLTASKNDDDDDDAGDDDESSREHLTLQIKQLRNKVRQLNFMLQIAKQNEHQQQQQIVLQQQQLQQQQLLRQLNTTPSSLAANNQSARGVANDAALNGGNDEGGGRSRRVTVSGPVRRTAAEKPLAATAGASGRKDKDASGASTAATSGMRLRASTGVTLPIDVRGSTGGGASGATTNTKRSPRTKKRQERGKNLWKRTRPEKRTAMPSTSPVPEPMLSSSLSPTSGAGSVAIDSAIMSQHIDDFDDNSYDEAGSVDVGNESLRTTDTRESIDGLPELPTMLQRSASDAASPPLPNRSSDSVLRASTGTASSSGGGGGGGGVIATKRHPSNQDVRRTQTTTGLERRRMHQSHDPTVNLRHMSQTVARDENERFGADGLLRLHRLCGNRPCDVDEIRKLLMSGVDVNREDATRCVALVHALRAQNYDAADMLLNEANVRVDVTDERGSSLIHLALLHSSATDAARERVCVICERVLELGEAPELVSMMNNIGITPLYSAFHSENIGVARLLLENGADINQRATSGQAPLLYVANHDMQQALELCFAYNCDVTSRDPQGNTALHLAARRNFAHVCERLLQNDADPSTTNFEGKIALDLASDKQTIKVLEDYDPRQKSWKWMIGFHELSFVAGSSGVLGRGNFSVVRLGRLHGTPVAVKFLKVGNVTAPQLAAFQQEVGLMSDIRHPNVLCFLGATLCYDLEFSPEPSPRRSSSSGSLLSNNGVPWRSGSLRWVTPKEAASSGIAHRNGTPRQLCIITELAEQSLRDHLKSLARFDAGHFVTLAITTARGMAWLHSRSPPVLHRDLHTRNVLLDKGHQCKVCDFGLSSIQVLTAPPPSLTSSSPGVVSARSPPPATPSGNSNRMRTPLYRRIIAPELRNGDAVYTVKADVFAYGLVLCELMFPHMDWSTFRAERGIDIKDMRTTPTLRDVEALTDSDALDPVRGIQKQFYRAASTSAGFFASLSASTEPMASVRAALAMSSPVPPPPAAPSAQPSPSTGARPFNDGEKRLRLMVLHLLKRCCARDPVERPTFEEILVEFDPFLIELDATFRRLVGAEVATSDAVVGEYEEVDSDVGDYIVD
jgi:serine/threonine protein kinase/ankyrin repeat protein